MSSPLEQIARWLVPSVPVLTHHRVVKAVLDAVDRITSAPFKEFRELPPNHLRVRVGVGNRLFFNQAQFLEYGAKGWIGVFGDGLADNRSSILELGCGCGRAAFALARAGFSGHYTGVDVDGEMIAWCQSHFPSEHFRFLRADTYSRVYNPAGRPGPYAIPLPDASQDYLFSQSLFTHLLEQDLENYVREAARVLKPEGTMNMGVFCLGDMRDLGLLGGRWTFEHPRGSARVESVEYPEAAVGYEREWLLSLCREAGFDSARVAPHAPQSALICRRAR